MERLAWSQSILSSARNALFVLLLVGCHPKMGVKESYNDIFPKESFLAKITQPVPVWMEEQLAADFKELKPVKKEALEKGYDTLLARLKNPIFIYHYRILDNQLYKYVPPGTKASCRDSYYEKALKTLLSHIQLPDLDFLLCPMDGIPEPIVAADAFFLEEQVPIFGQAKRKEPLTRAIILIPDQLSLARDWYNIAGDILAALNQVPWQEKVGKAFWRGRITDGTGETPRARLCQIAREKPEFVDASAEGPFVLREEHLRYKYQPTLDGVMCTYPGYQWRLLSNSLTLKQESDQIQWFYKALKPYVHYLPLANDMSDLVEKVAWAEAHEPEVLQMIENARKFVLNDLLYEDCYRYFYLALQRYAQLQQIDFAKLKKETRKDKHWVNIHYRKKLRFLRLEPSRGKMI